MGFLHAVYLGRSKVRIVRGLPERHEFISMENGQAIGHRIIHLASVDSTNNYAAKGIQEGILRHGTAIMAREQTAGKGQRGRAWSTSPGLDLAVSLVLIPERFPAMEQFALAKAAALAVHDVVAAALLKAGRNPGAVRIKWPNDVLVDRRKIAGVLIANELKGPWLASAIVGVGLNANSSGFPPELMATSLLQEAGLASDLHELLGQLCTRMEHWWNCQTNTPEVVSATYAERLWARNRFSDFTLDETRFTARPLDVDEAGRLIVEDLAGTVGAYGLERLRFIR